MKKNIVGLMLKTPESIQRQLSDAITFIGKYCPGGRKKEFCSLITLSIIVTLRSRGFPHQVGGAYPGNGGALQGWGLSQDQWDPADGSLPHQALQARVQEPGALGGNRVGSWSLC